MELNEKDYKWYIVHTQSGYEKKVRERIMTRVKEAGMTDLVMDSYIPSEVVKSVKNGKKVSKETLFYPGYVLVKMILNDSTHAVVRGTQGVAGFIGHHATTKEQGQIIPSPLSDTDVALIFDDRETKDKNDMNELMRMEYEIGEKIQVAEGPFSGLNGVIESINADKGKVTVSIEIFGRSTPTELDFLRIKKI